MGKVLCIWEVTPHSLVRYGMALLGSALPMVEFTTITILVKTIKAFFPYIAYQLIRLDDRRRQLALDQL